MLNRPLPQPRAMCPSFQIPNNRNFFIRKAIRERTKVSLSAPGGSIRDGKTVGSQKDRPIFTARPVYCV